MSRLQSSYLKRCIVALLFVCMPLPIKPVKADIPAKAGAECVMEVNSRRILYERNGDTRLPMASTTKILTAITAIENSEDLTKKIIVPPSAVGVEGSSVYLKEGDCYSLEELLYGLMLRSGNDAAVALALSVGDGLASFITMMNQTAEKAGALNSSFANPHGLPNEKHYTTARDLSFISCYAMQNQTFRTIVSTKYYTPKNWINKNKLLSGYAGSVGVKTGYTKQAGKCFVGAAKRGDMTLVCTLLNCPTTYDRTAELLDDCFAKYKQVELLSPAHTFVLQDGKTKITAVAKESFSYPLLNEETEYLEKVVTPVKESLKRKKNDEIVGQIAIYLSKRLLFFANLYKL